MKPILFESKSNSDHRGTVSFTNELNLSTAVRTYKVINNQSKTVRAWHGHKIEEKWISVEDGEFLVCAVKIDDFDIDGDFIESQAFAYLAIRSFLKLPISFPSTTGVKMPCDGGDIIKVKK